MKTIRELNGTENPIYESTAEDYIKDRIGEGNSKEANNIEERCFESELKHDSSWQPKCCSSILRYRWCPTYQRLLRLIAVVLIGLTTWYTLYIIVGASVLPPKGQIFQLMFLTVIAMITGWLVSLTNLPGLVGNLFIGALFQNLGIVDLNESFSGINTFLRGMALIVILVRAGLGLDSEALRILKFDIIKLGVLPWLAETLGVGGLAYLFLNMPLTYSLALGFAISAISPAVTVPSLLRLKSKGYGVSKGIPTLVMAITTLTVVFSVVCFGIIQSFIFSTGTLTKSILQLPVSIIGGIGFGLLWGLLCSFCPETYDSSVVSLRILMTLAGGILSVFGSAALGFGGAGPLACVTAPFVSSLFWSKNGWKVGENPVSTSFKFLWAIFEPILFAITGAQIKLNQLDGNIIVIGVGIIFAEIVMRTLLTIVLGIGSIFNLNEKIFFSMAMATKATVQAALAPVLMGLIPDNTSQDYNSAEKVMMICILSIIVTTPPLAIFMDVFGYKFLEKDAIKIDDEMKSDNSVDAGINVSNSADREC